VYSLNKSVDILSILKKIQGDFELKNFNNQCFNNFASINDAKENSLVFISNTNLNKISLIKTTPSRIIILDGNDDIIYEDYKDKAFIITNSPRTIFSRIINYVLSEQEQSNTIGNKNTFVSPKAEIGKNTSIGIGTIIGNAKIGCGCIVSNNVIIEDDCIIGDNVFIGNNVFIGAKALSIISGEPQSVREGIPQLGGVLIEDNVHIDSFSTIQRGTFGNTCIRENVKIDSYVQIAHNVEIEKNTTIIGHSKISGSVKIGIDTFIGQSVTIADGILIGSRVFICMGSVVIRNVSDGIKVSGNPAKPIFSPKL
jgi:UDP-3-O-[3-hydroxymyristoyl] glucosamine N-acyltransferase